MWCAWSVGGWVALGVSRWVVRRWLGCVGLFLLRASTWGLCPQTPANLIRGYRALGGLMARLLLWAAARCVGGAVRVGPRHEPHRIERQTIRHDS